LKGIKPQWQIRMKPTQNPEASTLKKIVAQNKQLKSAFKQQSAALEYKNRELNIQAALEKVRSIAMRMKSRDDMVKICKTIAEQLQKLGVKEIRNVQTAIFYPQRGAYMNYEFYARHEKTFITETIYTNHKIGKVFAAKMLQGEGEFFIRHIKGKKVQDWLAYQKTTNVFIDKYLNTATSLNYYWFSLGAVAMGVSSYMPLSENDLDLFKRFRNVFELAYKRYMDIEQAVAQAREAKIQVSLEKVRAMAMGMSKPADLLNVCETMYKEFLSLGFSEMRNAMINIHNDADSSFINYDYSDAIGKSTNHLVYDIHPLVERQIKKVRSADDAFSETLFAGKDLTEWQKFRKRIGEKDNARLNKASGLYYYFYSIGIGAIGISTFEKINEEKIDLLKRFRNVFKLSYQRYTDISKAEAQAHESKIETSLERVRAVAMAMKKSEDVVNVCEVMYKQLAQLGFTNIRNAQIAIKNDDRQSYLISVWSNTERIVLGEAPYQSSPIVKELYNELGKPGDAFYEKEYSGKKLKEWRAWRQKVAPLTAQEKSVFSICFYLYSIGNGHLGISTYDPITHEQVEILKRFKNVFELSYQRFTDVAKAEAQAHEAQIELALERVRARTMAMQKSEELPETTFLLFQQLKNLGETAAQLSIGIIKEEKGIVELSAVIHGNQMLGTYEVPADEPYVMKHAVKAWKEKQKQFKIELNGKKLKEYNNWRNSFLKQKINFSEDRWIVNIIFFSKGLMSFTSDKPISKEAFQLLERFAKVFEQTYTRFLDLQKAEAQSREAQIEVSLERVRSKAMAMHSSADLADAAGTLFTELNKLGINPIRSGFVLLTNKSKVAKLYPAASFENGKTISFTGEFEFAGHAVYEKQYESWQKKENYFPVLEDEELRTYYKILSDGLSISYESFPTNKKQFGSFLPFTEGFLFTWSDEPYSEKEINILNRFKTILELTIRRYLDLQKAEAQVREAQIEAALERVRSRSLAMHKSDEITEVVKVMDKMNELNIQMTVGVALATFIENSQDIIFWYVDPKHVEEPLSMRLPYFDHVIFKDIIEARKSGKELLPVVYSFEEKNSYFKYAFEHSDFRIMPDELKKWLLEQPYFGYSAAIQKHSAIFFDDTSGKLFSEKDNQILLRFSRVFEQAYIRFLDLQKAEMQAREAQIETCLERVRSRTLAMQKSDELAETASVLFRQLILLGIEPNRLYITIIKDEGGDAEFWITDEDGSKVSFAYTANLNNNTTFKKMFDGWKKEKRSLVIDMKDEELQEYFKYLSTLNVPFKGGLSQKRRVQHLAYFGKGFIGMASPEPQPEETIFLLERFAAVFNLTYTRFNDLQIAEAHALQAENDLTEIKTARKKAEETLAELQTTQKQLIQSEKMASLGELTAGIAHEIQNPLNFVNNFSEVSKELLDEMKIALENGDEKDAREIAEDVIQNLEKINHHGKRADAIVKGMLQHSRTNTGQKEATDINVLCDEYLRLAFHGLRAKDKTFNAKFETDFDESIEKINIVPQEIGRVILNLINNAFYAVSEKKKQNIADYEPTVTVITKRLSDTIEIKIKDNGTGIPQRAVDKIFQPFFTTKPTGSGTGLGLSLSYDIIKTHGGEIKVETKENEGTIFIIQLPVI